MASNLYIFGTGSHARKIFYYAIDLGWSVQGFIDEAIDACSPINGFNVSTANELRPPKYGDAIFVAVGDALVRERLMDKFSLVGWSLPAIIHRTAWVAPDASIGDGVLIAAGSVVETGARVGKGAIVDVGAIVDHDAVIREFSHLRGGLYCSPREDWPPF